MDNKLVGMPWGTPCLIMTINCHDLKPETYYSAVNKNKTWHELNKGKMSKKQRRQRT